MSNQYNLAIIGGGPGGYAAAIRASQLGLKVAVIEEREMGGTCLNRGCIPTKSLLHSAEVYQTAKNSEEFGVLIKDITFDYAKMALKKDMVVKRLRSGVEYLVKSNGGTIINGRGVIIDKNTIEVTGKNNHSITTDKTIIATGSRPHKPLITGIYGSKVLDSDEVLELTSCPSSVIIVGGGVIGMEFASLFNMFGKKVTVIEMMNEILPNVDIEISQLLRKSMEEKGVMIYTNSKVTSFKSEQKAICYYKYNKKEMSAEGDMIIVAVGRKPNTENIGLENVGIETDKGFIKVNDDLETSISGIYAIGDVTGKAQLAHLATAQGLVAVANVTGQTKKMDYSIVPSCIYTNPEIASVGMTELEASRKGYKLKIGRFPVSANGKSMIMCETEGLVKLITDNDTGEILGAHIMAPKATELISEICMAMKLESTFEEIADTIHPHPTVSEIIMEAAHDVEGLCTNKPKR